MIRFALILAALANPAMAGDTAIWSRDTYARIQPTQEPGAAAEIIFHNENVNDMTDNTTMPITLGALTVEVTFKWEVRGDGADQITVTTPAGFVAVPDTLTVPEGGSDRMLIYPETALGV